MKKCVEHHLNLIEDADDRALVMSDIDDIHISFVVASWRLKSDQCSVVEREITSLYFRDTLWKFHVT
jgi:hypothetical protein